MQILIGSTNPVKIEATRQAFSHYFDPVDAIGIEVDSRVSGQPVNDDTYTGAKNRALTLKEKMRTEYPNAAYAVGLEAGLEQTGGKWFYFGAVCIVDIDGNEGWGKSAHFPLPDHIIKRLLSGEELGNIIDEHTGEKNTKHKAGAIGLLTRDTINRTQLYVPGIIMALIPFLNKELYFTHK